MKRYIFQYIAYKIILDRFKWQLTVSDCRFSHGLLIGVTTISTQPLVPSEGS